MGGFEAMVWKYPRALADKAIDSILTNGTLPDCGMPPKDGLQMLRHPNDKEMPWPGFIFGQTTSSLWYWCADQVQSDMAKKRKSFANTYNEFKTNHITLKSNES